MPGAARFDLEASWGMKHQQWQIEANAIVEQEQQAAHAQHAARHQRLSEEAEQAIEQERFRMQADVESIPPSTRALS